MKNMYYIIPFMLAVYVYKASSTQVERCRQTYLSPNDLTCLYCVPGTFKVQDCTTNDTNALCKPCPENTYQRSCNRAVSCEPCQLQCDTLKRLTKIKNCTLYEDTICDCKDGYHRHQETGDRVCQKHTLCKVGYGMVNPGMY